MRILLCDYGTWEQLCDNYGGEVEDISVESRSNTSTSQVEITDSDSDSSADIQVLKWVEVKNSDLPYNIKNLSRVQDNFIIPRSCL
jgi:hypothetical protein